MTLQGLVGLQTPARKPNACGVLPSPKSKLIRSPLCVTPGENASVTCWPGLVVAGLGVMVRVPLPPPLLTIIVRCAVPELPHELVAVTVAVNVPAPE